MLIVPVSSMATVVIRSVIRIPPVVAIIAAWVITVIPRITVIAVPISRITESDPNSSDSD
jgi:hypothetical protein